GVAAARAARILSWHHGIEMPIVDAGYRVLYEDVSARDAVLALVRRGPRGGSQADGVDVAGSKKRDCTAFAVVSAAMTGAAADDARAAEAAFFPPATPERPGGRTVH